MYKVLHMENMYTNVQNFKKTQLQFISTPYKHRDHIKISKVTFILRNVNSRKTMTSLSVRRV